MLFRSNLTTRTHLAKSFKVDYQSLYRHAKKHLPAKLLEAAEAVSKSTHLQEVEKMALFAIEAKKTRLERLQKRWDSLDRIVAKRAAKADKNLPGDDEGILVNGRIDRVLLQEERAIARAATLETGEYLSQMGRTKDAAIAQGPQVVVIPIGLCLGEIGESRHQIRDSKKAKSFAAPIVPPVHAADYDLELVEAEPSDVDSTPAGLPDLEPRR